MDEDNSNNKRGSLNGSSSDGSVVSIKEDEFTASIPSEFECTICFKLLVMPTTTACGHTFCEVCLRMARQANPVCPLCREPLQGGRRPNVSLMNLIKREYAKLYREREEELETLLGDSFHRDQPIRGKPLILLHPVNPILMSKFQYRFPGDSVLFHTNDEELVVKLGLARNLGENIGVEVPPPIEHTETSSTASLYGLEARIDDLNVRRNGYQDELFVRFKICGRWEKEVNEVEQVNNHGLVIVQPFYDEGIEVTSDNEDPRVRREMINRYFHLVHQLNEEILKQKQFSGIAGSNSFEQLYGPVPAADQQSLTAEQIESNSFFYARIFRVPLHRRSRWFYIRYSIDRMEDVLAYVRECKGPYSILRLTTDEEESDWKGQLDRLLNHGVLYSSILAFCVLIGYVLDKGYHNPVGLLYESPICLVGVIFLIVYLVQKWKTRARG